MYRFHPSPKSLIAACLALTAATARADDWPLVRHDAQNTGSSQDRVRPPFRREWSINGATSEPLLGVGNTVFYTARRQGGLRDLMALDPATRRSRVLARNVTQTGAISIRAGMIFTVVRTTDKPTSVSKLGANLWPCAIAGISIASGKTLWKYPIGDDPVYPAVSPLTVSGHTVYMVNIPYCVPGDTCGPGQLIALNDRDGKEVAKYEWTSVWGEQTGSVDGAPMLDPEGARVVIGLGYQAAPGTYGGQLWGFWADKRLSDGPTFKLGDPSVGDGEVSPAAHKGGNVWPLLGGTMLAVQGPDDTTRVWNVSQFPAKEAWEIRFTRDTAHSIMPGGVSPLILEANNGTGMMSAEYLSTGKRIWSRKVKATGLSSTAGDVVYIPGQEKHPVAAGATGRTDILDGVLYAVGTLTGDVLWTERRPDVTFNTPIFLGGRMIVSDSDGTITCYQPIAFKPAVTPRKRPARRRR